MARFYAPGVNLICRHYRARLPNELAKVLEASEPYREELVGVVVESTYNWYWLSALPALAHRGRSRLEAS